MANLDSIIRRFILGERKSMPTVRGYVESVVNIVDTIHPRSQRESRQLSIAKEHLREINKINRKLEEKLSSFEEKIRGAQAAALGLEEKIHMLEEQINVLEEGKD